MEVPLSPPRAHAGLLCCSSTPVVLGLRSQSATAPSRRARPLLARRNRDSRSDEETAAEPKIITVGRPGKSGRRRNRKQQQQQQQTAAKEEEEEEEEDEDDEEERDATIPEVVTNRMMRRVGASVGLPLALGVGLFPVFYYLKAVAKVDVPTWIPFGVSFVFFGAALAGVSYGIVSASWDPAREGSLLGWNEARRNWPVFWDSLRGRSQSPPRRG
jgi:hypothetical protein